MSRPHPTYVPLEAAIFQFAMHDRSLALWTADGQTFPHRLTDAVWLDLDPDQRLFRFTRRRDGIVVSALAMFPWLTEEVGAYVYLRDVARTCSRAGAVGALHCATSAYPITTIDAHLVCTALAWDEIGLDPGPHLQRQAAGIWRGMRKRFDAEVADGGATIHAIINDPSTPSRPVAPGAWAAITTVDFARRTASGSGLNLFDVKVALSGTLELPADLQAENVAGMGAAAFAIRMAKADVSGHLRGERKWAAIASSWAQYSGELVLPDTLRKYVGDDKRAGGR